LVGLKFEFGALHLQSRHSTAWATPLIHFALVALEMGVSQTTCSTWPWTLILLSSASQVTSITSISHLHSTYFGPSSSLFKSKDCLHYCFTKANRVSSRCHIEEIVSENRKRLIYLMWNIQSQVINWVYFALILWNNV
jgi:hypothetical protein